MGLSLTLNSPSLSRREARTKLAACWSLNSCIDNRNMSHHLTNFGVKVNFYFQKYATYKFGPGQFFLCRGRIDLETAQLLFNLVYGEHSKPILQLEAERQLNHPEFVYIKSWALKNLPCATCASHWQYVLQPRVSCPASDVVRPTLAFRTTLPPFCVRTHHGHGARTT